ncbi:hypothetical protein CVR96_27090, partial [Salmonella enterica subsp. enterica serovar Typhimurium]|uniref:hypothetical protein n=1 Tax=Salmonella enterica TaxID=28901 RepID=UPI000CC08D4B
DDANVFHRYKITNLKKESGQFTLDGIYELFDDLKSRTIIEDRRPQNENATSALQTVLEGTGWQVGNVSTYNTGTTNWYYVTPLEAFWDYIETWRVEFSPRITFNGNQVIAKYID